MQQCWIIPDNPTNTVYKFERTKWEFSCIDDSVMPTEDSMSLIMFVFTVFGGLTPIVIISAFWVVLAGFSISIQQAQNDLA